MICALLFTILLCASVASLCAKSWQPLLSMLSILAMVGALCGAIFGALILAERLHLP
jgi:hypothetical protein